MINWQLSKQGICWLVLLDLIAGSGVDPLRSVFFKVIRRQVTSFQAIPGSSIIFLKFIWNMLYLCAGQLKFWFQTDLGYENSASYARKTVAFNHPSVPQDNQCLLSHFLTTLEAQEWHLSKQGIRWMTTWPYRGLRCRPIEVEYFFEVIRWQVTSFQMIAGSSLFF